MKALGVGLGAFNLRGGGGAGRVGGADAAAAWCGNELAAARGVQRWHLSLTHTAPPPRPSSSRSNARPRARPVRGSPRRAPLRPHMLPAGGRPGRARFRRGPAGLASDGPAAAGATATAPANDRARYLATENAGARLISLRGLGRSWR